MIPSLEGSLEVSNCYGNPRKGQHDLVSFKCRKHCIKAMLMTKWFCSAVKLLSQIVAGQQQSQMSSAHFKLILFCIYQIAVVLRSAIWVGRRKLKVRKFKIDVVGDKFVHSQLITVNE
ncbi:hypothetical protein M513_00483 [Trichuris suis]|uniref:Uncharacterized protein n=1 Tax=Trichuris suis TaxID=68888 RepID=A0A085MNJ4_9BILA|nr:hypothetical protein M513_00483 [Trichuris suis]